MARSVIWSESGADDFETAAEYLAQDSPAYASNFAHEIREASRSLSTFAERGRVVRELGEPGIREIYVQRYRMIYRVERDRVNVLAIIHGSRDLLFAWKEQKRQSSHNM